MVDDLDGFPIDVEDDNVGLTVGWITDFTLATLYLLVGVTSAVQTVRHRRIAAQKCETWNSVHVFHVLITTNCTINLIRNILLGVNDSSDDFDMPDFWWYFFNTLPGNVYFTTYILLILYWATMYHGARTGGQSSISQVKILCIVSNVMVWLCQIVLFVLFPLGSEEHQHTIRRHVSPVIFVVVSFASALGFWLYGIRVVMRLKGMPVKSTAREQRIKEATLITVVCGLAFSIRGAVVLYSISDYSSLYIDSSDTFRSLFFCIFYILVEIVPSTLLLFLFRVKARHTNSQHSAHSRFTESLLRTPIKTPL